MISLEARPGRTTERTRPDRRIFVSVLTWGVILAGCLEARTTAVEPSGAAPLTFEPYEVVLGSAARPTILPGFFRDGATAEIAVVQRDGEPRVRMYGLDGGAWAPVVEAELRPGVLFVDVAEIGGRDRLITYERGRLSWFDPDTAAERLLVELSTSYQATDDQTIPRLDITRDLNRDGLDDLLVPDVDGFWVATQSSDGSFAGLVKLGPPEPYGQHPVDGLDLDLPAPGASTTYGDVGITAVTLPWYLGRVHEMDHDQDGRNDLAFWNEDRFDVYHQNEQGRFDAVAESVSVDVPFEADGVYTRMFEYRDQGVVSLLLGVGKSTRRTVLHSLRDLDGDGVADLVTLTLEGSSLLKQRSVYEVHFGTSTPGGTVFAREVGTTIHPRGRAGGLEPWGYATQRFEDLDGDGQAEFLYRFVPIGLGGMMRALVGNSVPLDLELYRSDDGVYPEKPTIRRKIRRFAPFAGLGNVFFPPVLMGDVNGDGRPDVVVGRSPKELHVYLGVPGPDLLARQPQKVAVALPYDERDTWLVDLDKDGRQDLLVHRGPTEHAPDQPHRLTTLFVR